MSRIISKVSTALAALITTMAAAIPALAELVPARIVEVNYKTAALRLILVEGGRERIIERFPVALPKPGITAAIIAKIRHGGPITARVWNICMDCPWRPTARILRDTSKKIKDPETGEIVLVPTLPTVVKPYSVNKSNPTGVAFLTLTDWSRSGVIDALAGIHGTNAPKFVVAGARVSYSCIRNCNQYILEVVRFMKGHPTIVRFIAKDDPDDQEVRTMECDGIKPASPPRAR